jgi:hypothetical protein
MRSAVVNASHAFPAFFLEFIMVLLFLGVVSS